jgi:hypothetical protein
MGNNRLKPLISGMTVERDRFTIFPGEGLADVIRGELSVSYTAGIDLREVDPSILQVPFVLNAAPAVWALDLQCTLPSMDRIFFEALGEIREGYRALYPEYGWEGKIEPQDLVENRGRSNPNGRESLLFFSGGVDSTYSALRSVPGRTTLLSVRGHDIALGNDEAWEKAKGRIDRFAGDLGFKTETVSANVFRFLRYTFLHGRFPKLKPWYGTIQHALSLAGLAFPLAAHEGIREVRFSSSNDAIVAHLPWGAHGLLEPRIRTSDTAVRSIGADLDWIRKTEVIVSFFRERPEMKKPFLRVCLDRMSGNAAENCGFCVKCLRRATALLLFGEDPNDWGFSLPDPVFEVVRQRCLELECTFFDTYYWPEMAEMAKDRFEDAPQGYRDFFTWLQEWKPDVRIPSHNDPGGNP